VPVYRCVALDRPAILGKNERVGGGETVLSPEPHNDHAMARLIPEEEAQLLTRF
jgi:hypothetical protein